MTIAANVKVWWSDGFPYEKYLHDIALIFAGWSSSYEIELESSARHAPEMARSGRFDDSAVQKEKQFEELYQWAVRSSESYVDEFSGTTFTLNLYSGMTKKDFGKYHPEGEVKMEKGDFEFLYGGEPCCWGIYLHPDRYKEFMKICNERNYPKDLFEVAED